MCGSVGYCKERGMNSLVVLLGEMCFGVLGIMTVSFCTEH